MNFFKNWAWSLVKPLVKTWLEQRALRLPAVKVTYLAKQLGVPEAAVIAINEAAIVQAEAELDKFRP